MPQKPLDEPANDPQKPPLNDPNGNASLLIFISAHALGSLGFAVSIFAIWIGWLLPASSTAAPTLEPLDIKVKRHPSKSTRRHARAYSAARPLPIPTRRVSAPVDLTPILASSAEDGQTASRRVYFADSPPSPVIRSKTLPKPSSPNSAIQSIQQIDLGLVYGSPRSSTSTLPPHGTHPHCDCIDEATPDSDSRHSSYTSLLKPASRLQKFRLGFNSKPNRSESLDKPCDQSSIASSETAGSEKSARRASGGFVASWSLTRHRTLPDVTVEPGTPSPRLSFGRRMSPSRPATSSGPPTACLAHATDILSPTFLSRKAQKRTSAPIPRTSPYGAPYFALPPMLLDNNYPSYLKALPQFEDEVKAPLSASDTEAAEPARGRSSTIRRVSLNPPPRVLPKRRSASEDWTQRTDS